MSGIEETPAGAAPAAGETEPGVDGLVGRIELIEAQPLAEHAAGYEQLHDELLAELQRSDHGDR